MQRSPNKTPLGSRVSPRSLDVLSRTRLSKNFILRDFLLCASAAAKGFSNAPSNPDQVIASGRALCETILEPLLARFGRFAITFGYQAQDSAAEDLKASRTPFNAGVSCPHCWDSGFWPGQIYARVDILPFCVEDGEITKHEYGAWIMHNLDVDLLMQWTRSNVYCITISPQPRRVWLEWGRPSKGEPLQRMIMGTEYWQRVFPLLGHEVRPKFGPSRTGGAMRWPLGPTVQRAVLNETSATPRFPFARSD